MNYLAHIYLSGDDREMQLGNFIADAVKGTAYKEYPPGIVRGVLLHRAIDDYTDNHPAVREAVREMRPSFGRYAAVVLDIYFDYLLASRFEEYADVPLKHFARSFYWTMIRKYRYLPARIRRFMWHFILTDRLGRYAAKEGIRESLEIMVRYDRIDISVEEAIRYLAAHEESLRALFHPFFEELQTKVITRQDIGD